MKKIFPILTIAFVLTACNSSEETKITYTISDSLKAAESPLMDAVNTADSAGKIIQDSTGKMMDTLMKK